MGYYLETWRSCPCRCLSLRIESAEFLVILDDYDYAVNCLRNLEGMLATRTPSRHLVTAIAAHFATVRSLPLLVAVQDKLDYFHTLITELCLL